MKSNGDAALWSLWARYRPCVCVSRFPQFPDVQWLIPLNNGNGALFLHLVPVGRTVTQRICVAEGEEISSGRMNHPSICGNSCVVTKKLRKA